MARPTSAPVASRPPAEPAATPDAPRTRRGVHVAAGALVVAALALRAWALLPSWFYLDDYKLLLQARDVTGPGDLLTPFNGHLMPAGRLIALVVERSGTLDWALAASVTLGLQAVTSVAAWWMLTRLFGTRWAVVVPLAVYLFSTLTLSASMWWAACVSQLGIQLGFFVAVGAWVSHLRGDGRRWAGVTALGLAVALAFDVKGLLVIGVLGYVALAYFARGGPVRRTVTVARDTWRVTGVLAVLATGYLAYYLLSVDQPLQSSSSDGVTGLAGTMVGQAFGSAAVGGPWAWAALAPPNAFAAPPGALVVLAWIVIAGVVGYSLLRRRRALRAWALLALYLAVLLVLLVASRGLAYGPVIGLEYRSLTESACVLCLCLALAFLPLRGAVESSEVRTDLLAARVSPVWVVALTAAYVASSVLSTVRYAEIWHTQNASAIFVPALQRSLADAGSVDLADTAVPEGVVPQEFAPDNSIRLLTPLLSDRVDYPDVSDALQAVAPDGSLVPAQVVPAVVSQEAPDDGCGWRVDGDDGATGADVPLTARAFDYVWWVQIGYLSSAASPVTVSAGDTEVRTQVGAGLGTLHVRVVGAFDEVRLSGLADDTTLCVGSVTVGDVVQAGLP